MNFFSKPIESNNSKVVIHFNIQSNKMIVIMVDNVTKQSNVENIKK
jgi:hypothetical protein